MMKVITSILDLQEMTVMCDVFSDSYKAEEFITAFKNTCSDDDLTRGRYEIKYSFRNEDKPEYPFLSRQKK